MAVPMGYPPVVAAAVPRPPAKREAHEARHVGPDKHWSGVAKGESFYVTLEFDPKMYEVSQVQVLRTVLLQLVLGPRKRRTVLLPQEREIRSQCSYSEIQNVWDLRIRASVDRILKKKNCGPPPGTMQKKKA